ncbi:mitochondrial GTPase 1 [Lycorma delicatula]|uniref:mitochondrial GTPase 1 n=1 Tax=Lycorma delicatula TaxID=130591 RepID=UPI003F50E175
MVLCSNVLLLGKTFRSTFKIPDKTKLRWFPGHMSRGLKVMQQKLKNVDCIIEVHDARIPVSGRNPNFKDTVSGLRPHILVLNKADLTDELSLDKTLNILKKQCSSEIIFTNCKDSTNCKGVNKLINVVHDICTNTSRHNRNEEREFCAMIIGVPNVGKSSLINRLRNRFLKKSNAVTVGPIAGITRAVGTKIKVCQNPLIYIFDTPGILTPVVPDVEVGMKLALCGTFKDSEVDVINIADYLLYWLNKHNCFSYVNYLNLKEPTDNITEVLTVSAVHLKLFLRMKDFGGNGGISVRPDLSSAANNFVTAFRKGSFGTFNLDIDIL